MPPDAGLFPQQSALLESFGKGAEDAAQRSQAEKDTNKNLASRASTQLGEDRRQQMALKEQQAKLQQQEQAKMQLEELKGQMRAKGNMMHIPPEVAIGLSKNTGDPSFLKYADQDM